MRSPQEIIRQTNELARELYAIRGYEVDTGYDFQASTHPRAIEAWRMACAAQLHLTDTDIAYVLDELEEAA